MSRRIVLPGGSGFLGKALAQTFSQEGWEVVVLSRHAAAPIGAIRTVPWNGQTLDRWVDELDGADAVVNLAGCSIACLHTPENRQEIVSSRMDSVGAIDAAVAQCHRAPAVLIQASAVGIYGDAGDRFCDETAPSAGDFVAEVVATFENAFFARDSAGGPRRIALRIGLILGRDGGGLAPLARLARLFLGGAAGNGRQYISWLHEKDFCAACQWLLTRTESRGIYNAVGPKPVANAEFMRELRKALGRPWSPPAPAWAVDLIARFAMKVEPSLALSGCRCLPRRLLAEGFTFQYPDLAPALGDLLAAKMPGK